MSVLPPTPLGLTDHVGLFIYMQIWEIPKGFPYNDVTSRWITKFSGRLTAILVRLKEKEMVQKALQFFAAH